MAKTKEELNAIKEEIETLNEKLSELNDEELKHVTGGENSFTCLRGLMTHPLLDRHTGKCKGKPFGRSGNPCRGVSV